MFTTKITGTVFNKFGRETVFSLLSFCHIDPVISLKSNCFVTYFCFHWSMNDCQLLMISYLYFVIWYMYLIFFNFLSDPVTSQIQIQIYLLLSKVHFSDFFEGQHYLQKIYILINLWLIRRDVFPYPIFHLGFEGIWVFDFPCLRW